MNSSPLTQVLWGKKAKVTYLLFAAAILLFTLLGTREIWTQEHRWADIVSGMLFRHDFFHPYLGENDYYDKPLLSYWLVVLFAQLLGDLNTWALRLPSALSGILAIWSIYRIGTQVKNKELGLLSGWLLLTTFYFIFWARTSSADMLNLGGTLFAISWYMDKRATPSFFNYSVFFLVLALTSLCKGLVGAVVPLLVVAVDLFLQNSWKKHLTWRLFLGVIPALVIYLLPFWMSTQVGGESYGQNGLYLVYKENVLRYFHPFDHKDPIWTYFLYLPIYLMPWTLLLIPALLTVRSRWRTMSKDSKWVSLSLLVLFLFFTLSGSRRSYYVLPIVPFAVLFIADWMQQAVGMFSSRQRTMGILVGVFFAIFFVIFNVLFPLYYAQTELQRFVGVVKERAQEIKPWSEWDVVLLDAESKVSFYLSLPPSTKNMNVIGNRKEQTINTILTAWPMLTTSSDAIFISRKQYAPLLKQILVNYEYVDMPFNDFEKIIKKNDLNGPVAFIPLAKKA